MLGLKFIREHEKEIRDTIRRQRNTERMEALDTLLDIDKRWRSLKLDVDNLRSERNKLSETINKVKKLGGDIKPLIERAKKVPLELKKKNDELLEIENEIKDLLRKIPNIMHEAVPYGRGEEDNVEVYKWGVPRKFEFKIKNHVELCEGLGIADFEAAAKTTGNGFYFLEGDLALLNQALIRLAITKLVSKGYKYIEPPLMVRKEILDAAMDSEGFEQSIYKVEGEGEGNKQLCLIGTAEHAILGLNANRTIKASDLPQKFVGYSMCFRREIGSHGINEKGLWRTHQFNKVEQFIFSTPEQSWELYEELMNNSKELLEDLGLPYRIVEICTGDLAVWKSRSHDFEVWRPTTKSYGEVMSLSNCTAYQSTDLNIRFLRDNGERGFVHTLNNTAIATSRIMVAILENYQNEDGTVTVPEVLVPIIGKKVIGG